MLENAGFVVSLGDACDGSLRRRARKRGLRPVQMVLSGFLTELGDYPVLPKPVAPPLPVERTLPSEDRVEVFSSENGRGLRTRNAAKRSEVLVRLPRRKVIQVLRKFELDESLPAEAEAILGLRQSFWREERRVVGDWRLRLAIRLLIETRINYSLTEYFGLLPRNVDLPVFWSREEILEVQHFELQIGILRQKIQWEKICELVRQNSSTLDEREVLWALSIVRSRAFCADFQERQTLLTSFIILWGLGVSMPFLLQNYTEGAFALTGGLAVSAFFTELQARDRRRRGFMAPVADMMNHHSGSLNSLTYDAFSDSFLIRAGKDLREGEEIFFEYNERGVCRPNEELFQHYGFIQENNPSDNYRMCDTLNQLFNEQRFGFRREDIPERLNRKTLALRAIDGGGVVLKRMESGEITFNKVFLKMLKKMTRTEKERRNLVKRICERELQEKATTIEEDQALASISRSKSGSNSRKLLAVQYRLQNKKMLVAAIEQFS